MFGENLKTLRKQKGFSQEELATRLHVVRQTISKWEKNLSVPDADTLIRLAEILEVSVSELLGAKIENENTASDVAEQLSRINEQLAITGSNIIYLRIKFLSEIERIAKEKHRIISETEELRLEYDCSFLEGERELEDILQKFRQSLEERKTEEFRRAQACVGPHRDDIIFYINENEATKFASQGQQRTVVLALKLSELDIITAKTGDELILLLDDVLAELDDLRQNYLLKSITAATQVVITSVDTLLFDDEFLKDVKIYKVENGNIV